MFRKILLPLLILVYTIVIWRASQITFENAGKARNQIRGDSYTESLAWNGARYFYDHGFWPTRFMPNYYYTGEIAEKKIKEFDKNWIYTHYPSLPDVMLGVSAILLNTTDIRYLRIVPILFSFLFLWILWHSLKMLLPPKEAWLSFIVLLLSNYFVAWADNLHKFLYEEILKWAILLLFLRRFLVTTKPYDLFLLGMLYFLVAWISFDAIVVAAVMCIGFSWIYRKKIFTLETIIPGIMTVLALGLHWLQNVSFWGSWEAAWQDISKVFVTRTVGTENVAVGKLTFTMWLGHFFYSNINRIERYFLIPGWAILFFAFYFFHKWKAEGRQSYQFIPLFLIAAISWNCVMWQHAYIHASTARNWGLLVGLLAGPSLLFLWEKLKNFSSLPPLQKAGVISLSLYVLAMAISQHFWDLYLKHGLLHTFLN